MSDVIRTILKKDGWECIFDDGLTYSGADQLLPAGVDYIVYPDYHGNPDVRVEKNVNDKTTVCICHEPYTSHQTIITQAKDAAIAVRATVEAT